MNNENDLIANKWEKYEKQGLKFFTIWDFPERDPLNIVPYRIKGSCPVSIPLQCIIRYSKKGELVLDPFCGSGTTLIACSFLERKGVAIELNGKIIEIANQNLNHFAKKYPENKWSSQQKIIQGDSIVYMKDYIKKNTIDLVFAHPPYWNLIDYSQYYSQVNDDLSSLKSFNEFLIKVDVMFKGIYKILRKDRYACILIGDVFPNEKMTIPLDFYFTEVALKNNFQFINKIIKITHNSSSKNRGFENIKFRSIKSNFIICNHDYLLIFRK